MQGYYKMPEEDCGDSGGRLAEGQGIMGYAELRKVSSISTGRKKNLIITKNGENVSPEELEKSAEPEPPGRGSSGAGSGRRHRGGDLS